MRSTFTDWAAEAGYDLELREMALAHATGDATERAYRRTDLIAKRRPTTQAWSDFATGAYSEPTIGKAAPRNRGGFFLRAQ